MAKLIANYLPLRSKSHTSNKRVIDLVLLAKCSAGDKYLEMELLNRFSQTVKICFKSLKNSSNEAEMNNNLDALLLAANGVGANALISYVVKARAENGENEDNNQEMIADIGFLIEESLEFIAQISQ